MLSKHCPLLFFSVRTSGSNGVTFSHLADAIVQTNEQGRELVDANWKAVLSTEHISHLIQNPRFYLGWPSGLRRCVQVAVSLEACVRIPLLTRPLLCWQPKDSLSPPSCCSRTLFL